MELQIIMDTALGQIVAGNTSDPNYPGIYIDFKPTNSEYQIPIALVEVNQSDPSNKSLNALVWSDTNKEDYSYKAKIDLEEK